MAGRLVRHQRSASAFRNWVTADGKAGPSGIGGFKAEAGRYHLYVSHACPWAHRTVIFRRLKGLEEAISHSVANGFMGKEGWTFEPEPEVIPDPILGASCLHQIYTAAKVDYSGRVTVPVLWDKQQGTIVSNESSEIIRMLNAAFDGLGATPGDYYPEDLRQAIQPMNERIHDTINNGVYKCGFATTQEAYEAAIVPLFESLDWLDARLGERRYLMGTRVTEADWRLFTTLLRFDSVYVGHFKCNLRRLIDYPNLWAYTRELYQWPEVSETAHLDRIKAHYYRSHETVNPTRIVPAGPLLDFAAAHGRDHLARAA